MTRAAPFCSAALCGTVVGGAIFGVQPASANPYDLSEVTRLAQGAVTGQTTLQPIPGFELMILKDGAVIYRRSFGSWSPGRVASADSATKTLSGAVIVSLLDDNVAPFSLNTRLSEYMPEFSGLKQSITVRQCFAHFSGLPTAASVLADPNVTLRQAATAIAAGPLPFAPAGGTFAYGGPSMHAAGALAEIVGGAPWNTLFQQRIADRLGFTVTRYTIASPSNPRIAGGAESNAPEFAEFMEMLRRGGDSRSGVRVLSPGAVADMFTRQPPVGIPVATSPLNGSSDYGVGVWLDRRGPGGVLTGALAAGARGFSSWIDFDDGMVGVVATDLSGSATVVPFAGLIRDAAEAAIRACIADLTRDDELTFDDLQLFVLRFNARDPRVDFTLDGELTFDDVQRFIMLYNAGC